MYVDTLAPNCTSLVTRIIEIDTISKHPSTQWIHKEMLDTMFAQP